MKWAFFFLYFTVDTPKATRATRSSKRLSTSDHSPHMRQIKFVSQLLFLMESVAVSEAFSDSNEWNSFQYAKWLWDRTDGSDAFITDFFPHDSNMTCTTHTTHNALNRQVRGVNLGGLFVLEPWITPSLFYQFLDPERQFGEQTPYKTAMDTFTFCEALGKEEANRQLRIHYANWVTEKDIQQLAMAGVNSLRLPVGDWMFVAYEPYTGCTDGAIEHLDRVLKLAEKYKLQVLLDIHGHIGSQNGADNSGQQKQVEWVRLDTKVPSYRFVHWPTRSADWVGKFDVKHQNYTYINYKHLLHSLKVVRRITERYATHPAINGLETVNEPWQFTPLRILKEFYWKSYKVVRAIAPHWTFVMHDSFRFNPNDWRGFMKGCPGIVLDTHFYLAWRDPGTKETFFSYACKEKSYIAQMENAIMPVIVGEWSLATDNCAMWLNGFNDDVPGYPKVKCSLTQCPVYGTYLGRGFPGLPLDVTKASQGPFGTGHSGPSYGFEKNSLYVLRAFKIWNGDDSSLKERNIVHIQLTCWPDHGVPQDFGAIRSILDIVAARKRDADALGTDFESKVIVHCSAGIGRSGTLIAIDIVLRQLRAALVLNKSEAELQDALNIAKVVYHVRCQRPLMVQTPVRSTTQTI
ncbi:hypothetical protein ABG067_006740 [Albugo candida]